MEYNEFLNLTISDGMNAARCNYDEAKDANKLSGALAGFEACRDKEPEELREIYTETISYINNARRDHDLQAYWYFRCYQLEVEWVCNVVSGLILLTNASLEKNPFEKELLFDVVLPYQPTSNGMQKMYDILTKCKK